MRPPVLPRLALSALLTAACTRSGDGAVTAVGTVELVETDVSPTVAGRVSRVWVDEGAAVRAGDTLFTLTSPTQPAELSARNARVAQAAAELRDLSRGARSEDVERAAAELRAAGAEADRAARDLERLTPLAAAGTISQQQLDAARAAARQSAARRDAARHALELLQAGPRADAVAAARARVAEAGAELAASQRTAGELTLVAPASGVVLSRWVEVGELVAPGQAALTLGDAARPWARIYVNQRDLPRVKVGGPASGRLDGLPDRAFAGRVVAVSPQAEFSPRVALTEDERADLVFGVKVEFADSSGALKAGLPITGRLADGVSLPNEKKVAARGAAAAAGAVR
jgi:HlyD family secretion protein